MQVSLKIPSYTTFLYYVGTVLVTWCFFDTLIEQVKQFLHRGNLPHAEKYFDFLTFAWFCKSSTVIIQATAKMITKSLPMTISNNISMINNDVWTKIN